MNLLNTRQPYNSVALVCIRTSFKDELGWSKSIGLEYLKLSIKDYCNVITLYGDIDASELQKYDVIGFSLNAENIKNSIRVAETLKNLSKKCIIIVGGPLIDESNIANVAIAMKANFAIIGEGELALVHLVQKRFAPLQAPFAGIAIMNGAESVFYTHSNKEFLDVNLLPNMTLEECSIEEGIVSLSTSRGCPYNCHFCSCNMGRRWRAQNVNKVIEQVRCLSRETSLNFIRFVDANFFVDPYRAYEILRGIYNIDSGIRISFDVSADQIIENQEVITEMKKMNLDFLEVGIESGGSSVLDSLGKGIDRTVNERCIGFLQKNSISFLPDYIMWTPWITERELKENYLFLFEQKIFVFQRIFCKLIVYPNTQIFRCLEAEGNLISHNWKYDYAFLDSRTALKYRIIEILKEKVYFALVEVKETLQTKLDLELDSANRLLLSHLLNKFNRSAYWLFSPVFIDKIHIDQMDSIINKIQRDSHELIAKSLKQAERV